MGGVRRDNPSVEPVRAAPDRWFAERGWQPFDFQREVWAAMADGRSGLLHATTGSGKTYAAWLGALLRARPGPGLQVLWLTPMRALAADTVRALQEPLPALAPQWQVGARTGDTGTAERARQERRWPPALVTTPESLSLLLAREEAPRLLGGVHTVVVDEWHELLGSKRGVQVQLALARLRRWNPDLVAWGLSATLGNLDEALRALVARDDGLLVRGRVDKTLTIDTLLPAEPGRFSWGGHLGAQMLEPVVGQVAGAGTTLVFTNVRSQAETWYQLLLQRRPDWAGAVAVHHGSLDPQVRAWVEAGLKAGTLKAVVATSSLDLGVDFLPVERVLQIGSAKGVARLLQRAGRSGHAPGRASRVTLVPTNTLELVEAAAARRAALAGRVEARASPDKPLDVLVQHLVTVALGGGFEADPCEAGEPGGAGSAAGAPGEGGTACPPSQTAHALYEEVRSAPAYATLTRAEFDWALRFCERGGDSLGAYPDYHRIAVVDGRWRVPDRGVARRHRMQVGTIVADASMAVKWLSGGTLGQVEEAFVARLKPGDCFVFAGRVLEYVRAREMTAYVRASARSRAAVPYWGGSRMPLSGELADAMQELLHQAGAALQGAEPAAAAVFQEPELRAALPMLQAQARLSRLPAPGVLLAERLRSREGHHLFVYPFAGRNVHVGLAQLLAWRLARGAPNTWSISVNDHGFELLAAREPPAEAWAALVDGSVFATGGLLEDVLASLNSGELAQRRFREIARVAGLVSNGYPGSPRSQKQLQASSSLFFDVFRKYDPGNRLLAQAEREVLSQELELQRLEAALRCLGAQRLQWAELRAPSPFALPLMVERFRERLSTEQLKDRLDRLVAEGERALAQPARAGTAGGRARPSRRARPQPEAPPGVQAAVEAAP
jgi:ATP-dependent Lhr-like helicase